MQAAFFSDGSSYACMHASRWIEAPCSACQLIITISSTPSSIRHYHLYHQHRLNHLSSHPPLTTVSDIWTSSRGVMRACVRVRAWIGFCFIASCAVLSVFEMSTSLNSIATRAQGGQRMESHGIFFCGHNFFHTGDDTQIVASLLLTCLVVHLLPCVAA